MLNFVTNQSLHNTSGGWSGISANIHAQMRTHFPVTYVGPIEPAIPIIPKAISKALRTLGLRGGLPVFGNSRLNQIEAAWRTQRHEKAHFDLFHAATPWVKCRPAGPYGAYVDATFRMYLDIYTTRSAFSVREVEHIAAQEGEWMRNAAALFFGSRWVRDIAVAEHHLDPSLTHVLWVGGNVPVPPNDEFDDAHTFLFISLNFERKGGRIAADALEQVRHHVPHAELLILGERPPEDVLGRPGISYGGMLRKTNPDELARFVGHLSKARALIHPTSMDTMGAVLIEAGYYGCPSIATRQFGIPELILDHETGLLLDTPIDVNDVAKHMLFLSTEDTAYRKMRQRVREDMLSRLTWDTFGDRMAAVIAKISPSLRSQTVL